MPMSNCKLKLGVDNARRVCPLVRFIGLSFDSKTHKLADFAVEKFERFLESDPENVK